MHARSIPVLLLSAVSCILLGAQSAHGQGTTEGEREVALAAYDAGDLAKARPLLERLCLRRSGDFAVQEALGLVYAEAGDSQGALPHLDAAMKLRPQDAGANANLGAAYLQLKRYGEAVRFLETAARLEPSNADAQANLGHALFFHHELERAAQALAKAHALRPEDGDLVYDQAVALDGSHQADTAVAVLSSLPESQRTAAVEALWGDAAEHAGRYQEAAEHMKRAAKLEPSEQNLYALTAELLRHWTWRPAEQVAEYGLDLYPASNRLLFAKGVAYYGDTRFSDAADVFAGLLKREPENNSYGDLLGRSCSALGGATAASCTSLVEFAERHPENARAGVFAAISILHKPEGEADLPTAERLLQRSIAHDPGNAQAYYELGVLQQQRRDWEQSAVSLRKAVQLRETYAEAHYRLSRAYAHTGHPELARAELDLQQRYVQEEKRASEAQLKEVTIFLTDAH